MVQITVGVDGMACSMCEAHVSDAIRKAFPVKKVTASHTKGQAVIVAENEIAEADIAKALEPTGYRMVSYSCAPYQKRYFWLIAQSVRFIIRQSRYPVFCRIFVCLFYLITALMINCKKQTAVSRCLFLGIGSPPS